MKLYLMRHAKPEPKDPEAYPDDSKRPLSGDGRKVHEYYSALLKGMGIKVEKVLTSPFARARETAEIIADQLGIDVIPDERFKERGVGEIAGLNSEEINRQYPGLLERWRSQRKLVAAPGGEDPQVFSARVVEAFDELVARHPDGVVAVVTHGGVLGIYLGHVVGVVCARAHS